MTAPNNSQVHHRRSIRWKGYDYSLRGLYFLTICTQGRRELLGRVVKDKVHLTPAGLLVQETWIELPHFYGGVALDAFVVMPNHIHGVVALVHPLAGSAGRARGPAPTISVPDVVRRFKTLTTTRYIQGVRNKGWPSFDGRLWQRNYYERVIRSPKELENIQGYILQNPARWESDRENPNALSTDDRDPWS